MNERTAVLLCSVALAGIATVFFYATHWRRQSTTMLQQICGSSERNAARSAATYRLLKRQRRSLRALSDYILPDPKGA